MTLTRDFKDTIQARARKDSRFREALFTEALNAYLAGDTTTGKAVLRDLVNATIGFAGLAQVGGAHLAHPVAHAHAAQAEGRIDARGHDHGQRE